MWELSIKVPIRKKSGNLFNDPRIYDRQKNEKNPSWVVVFVAVDMIGQMLSRAWTNINSPWANCKSWEFNAKQMVFQIILL